MKKGIWLLAYTFFYFVILRQLIHYLLTFLLQSIVSCFVIHWFLFCVFMEYSGCVIHHNITYSLCCFYSSNNCYMDRNSRA